MDKKGCGCGTAQKATPEVKKPAPAPEVKKPAPEVKKPEPAPAPKKK
jgi:hypothetical protein